MKMRFWLVLAALLLSGSAMAQLPTGSKTEKKTDEGKENGRYIRRERFSGTYSRSFYVGEDVKDEDVKAKYDNGTLKLFVPDKEKQPKVEEKKFIAIEG